MAIKRVYHLSSSGRVGGGEPASGQQQTALNKVARISTQCRVPCSREGRLADKSGGTAEAEHVVRRELSAREREREKGFGFTEDSRARPHTPISRIVPLPSPANRNLSETTGQERKKVET